MRLSYLIEIEKKERIKLKVQQNIEGKKKLRLILWKECGRHCDGCVNKQWDMNKLPVVRSFKGFNEIMLTGGEPLLYPNKVLSVISKIKQENSRAAIYLYTALTKRVYGFLSNVDGIVLTIHEQKDVPSFITLNNFIKKNKKSKHSSLRLNIFKDIDLGDADLSLWKVKKNMIWLKDCPLPKDEVLMKYKAN